MAKRTVKSRTTPTHKIPVPSSSHPDPVPMVPTPTPEPLEPTVTTSHPSKVPVRLPSEV